MRKVLLGTLAAGLLALGVPAASAHDNTQVRWTCAIASIPNFVNGQGANEYRLVGVAVTPETGGGTFWCEIRLGGVTQASSIHAHSPGAVFATAGPLRGWRSDPQAFEVCGHITWDDGHTDLDSCTPTVALPNDPVTDVINLVNSVATQLDPAICSVLIAAAPTVDSLGHPEVIWIDPATGDLFIGGAVLTPPPGGDRFWDCPPYVTG